MSLARLPLDVLGCIYTYLQREDQLAFRLVCSHWHNVIKYSGVQLTEASLRTLDIKECLNQPWARFVRGLTIPDMTATRTAPLLAALPQFPDLRHLSVPSLGTLDKLKPLPSVKQLTLRVLKQAEVEKLAHLPPIVPSLASLDVDLSTFATWDEGSIARALQKLQDFPVVHLGVFLTNDSPMDALTRLDHLTQLDLTIGSSYRGNLPDLAGLPTLRTLSLSVFARDRIDMRRFAHRGLTSLSYHNRETNVDCHLPSTLQHLVTSDWYLARAAPTSLRSLAISGETSTSQLQFLSAFTNLRTLTLPLALSPGDFVATLTRLEELGAKAVEKGLLGEFPHLRTLRLACDVQALPREPPTQVRTLHISSPQRIDATGLQTVALWSQLRDLDLKGQWASISLAEWRHFAAAMPNLLVFRLLYTMRKPPADTVAAAIDALAGRRLIIES